MKSKLATAAGICGSALWMAVLLAELRRAGLAHSLIARPDRMLGWDGAAFWAPLTLATAAGAVLVIGAALGSRAAFRGRGTGRVTHAVVATFVSAAALAVVAIQLFPPDRDMYQTSSLRGTAAWILIAATPAAAAVAGIGLLRAGSTVVGWASLAGSVVMLWLAADTGLIAATGGASQPETEVAIFMEVALALWTVGLSAILLGLRGRPSVTGLGSLRSRLALSGLGGAMSILLVFQMAASLMSYSYLGPQIAAQLGGRTQAVKIDVAGVTRTYRVHKPATLDAHPGLIISLSGVFGDGFQAEWSTGFDDDVDRLGWIAVYPDSVLDGWMAYGWNDTWGNHPGADDVPLLAAIIDREIASDGVDPGRVFVSGMSRGGMMSHRAGCELADRVAAIAPVAGNMATASGTVADVPCHPVRPISVFATHGTADNMIPFNGGKTDIAFSPFEDVMAKWRSIDGCLGAAGVTADDTSTTTTWQCASGTVVTQRVIAGGGHSWPGDASRLISDFFAAHARD